jgi:GAF domain-containing protein
MATPERSIHRFLSAALSASSTPEPERAIEELARALVREGGYRAAIVRLLDPARRALELVAAHGLSRAYLDKGTVELAQSVIDSRVLAGEVVELADVTEAPTFQYPQAARVEGIRSMLAVPLRLHGEPRGLLRVYTAEPHHYGDDEQELLVVLADRCAEALECARCDCALDAIARELAEHADASRLVERVLGHAADGLGLAAVLVRLLDARSGRLAVAGARGFSPRYLEEDRRGDDPFDARVLAGETVIVHDLEREHEVPRREATLAEGIRSILSVPLRVRGRAIGLLRACSSNVRRFAPREVRFVMLVAQLAALALDGRELALAGGPTGRPRRRPHPS